MFDTFRIPLSWPELAKRTIRAFIKDDCVSIAAELAYYFFLALFPALLFLLALASFFPLHTLTDDVTRALASVAPADVVTLLTEQMKRISDSNDAGLLTLGFAGALWSSSTALTSIVSSLNRVYEIEDARPWWKIRLIAIALTGCLALLVLASFTLVVAGPAIARLLTRAVGSGIGVEEIWRVLEWPLAFALVTLAVGLVFYYGPDAEQAWEWITPGAVLATALWLLASAVFRIYVANFTDYNAAYGAVGGVIILLLWLYISGMALLAGAEMNAAIEHASPYGKDPGEKRPGERRKLGRVAAEAHRRRLTRGTPSESAPSAAA